MYDETFGSKILHSMLHIFFHRYHKIPDENNIGKGGICLNIFYLKYY